MVHMVHTGLKDEDVADIRLLGDTHSIYVDSPYGKVLVTHVLKTVPLPVWELRTETYTLEGAYHHLVMAKTPESVECEFTHACLVRQGDLVYTQDGLQQVLFSGATGMVKELYDLRVDHPAHCYYTNGMLSHNSTGIGASMWLESNLTKTSSLYLAPMPEHISTFGLRLIELQRASIVSPDYMRANRLTNNKYTKETKTGSVIKMMHVLSDVTKVRGQTMRKVCIDEAQSFDPDHIPEIEQIQKSFLNTKSTIYAGTSLDSDTCLEHQFNEGSGGIWQVKCSCKDKYHSLGDINLIDKLMSPTGLRCPNNGRLLNPLIGEFVHLRPGKLDARMASFHLPQVIVPAYCHGDAWHLIWRDYKKYEFKKFAREVWGLAVDTGAAELSQADLMDCCADYTFASIQADMAADRRRFTRLFSGVDWGGSDWDPATKTKQSYTVHTVYGLDLDGRLWLVHARRYSGMHYNAIIESIIENHKRLNAFSIGTDNGGGAYYNAYLRDSGKIDVSRFITFAYTDTKNFLSHIEQPYLNLFSLNRTDSLSALIADVKDKKYVFPAWEDSSEFVMEFLNIRRVLVETDSGKTSTQYRRKATRPDDFVQSTNYATMQKRIIMRESTIPNEQVLDQIGRLFGTQPIAMDLTSIDYGGGAFCG